MTKTHKQDNTLQTNLSGRCFHEHICWHAAVLDMQRVNVSGSGRSWVSEAALRSPRSVWISGRQVCNKSALFLNAELPPRFPWQLSLCCQAASSRKQVSWGRGGDDRMTVVFVHRCSSPIGTCGDQWPQEILTSGHLRINRNVWFDWIQSLPGLMKGIYFGDLVHTKAKGGAVTMKGHRFLSLKP